MHQLCYLFLLPPREAVFLRPPVLALPAPLFLPPPFLPPALLDLADEVEDEALREAARVAVRVVFSAALAERLATFDAARVCLRTCLVPSLEARLTASLTLLVEELEPLDDLRPRDEPLGRITSAAAGLTMPTMLAADSIMPVATLEAWSITSPVTSAA
jgi:hypothetical protein